VDEITLVGSRCGPFAPALRLLEQGLVDPLIKTLEAYALRESHWSLLTTLKDEDRVRLAPFDAIEFSLADLWG
jgi:hypothetical protein